jgi:hypothetical protein
MALGYLFNLNRGAPLVKKGGVIIITHPCSTVRSRAARALHRVLPPMLTETRDAMELHKRFEREFARTRRTSRCTARARVPRGPPLLHVVLGRERPPARRQGHRRRRRQQPRARHHGLGSAASASWVKRSASISFVKIPPILQTDVAKTMAPTTAPASCTRRSVSSCSKEVVRVSIGVSLSNMRAGGAAQRDQQVLFAPGCELVKTPATKLEPARARSFTLRVGGAR